MYTEKVKLRRNNGDNAMALYISNRILRPSMKFLFHGMTQCKLFTSSVLIFNLTPGAYATTPFQRKSRPVRVVSVGESNVALSVTRPTIMKAGFVIFDTTSLNARNVRVRGKAGF